MEWQGKAEEYLDTGNMLYDEGKFEEAIEKYRKGTEIDPNDAQAFMGWGVALRNLKRYNEAIEKWI